MGVVFTPIFFCFFTLRNKSCVLAYAWMKNFTHTILGILCVFLPQVCAVAEPDAIYIDGDYTFNATDVINADIYITNFGTITNYGVLSGTVDIAEGEEVTFQNFGQITSSFTLNGAATVVQIVTSADDLHKIENLTGHTVRVQGTAENILNMTDFINVVSGASTVEIESGAFLLDANVSYNNVPFDMHNVTVLYVNGIPNNLSRPLIMGYDGTPILRGVNIDPMYEISLEGHLLPSVYARVVRRTDYVNIMPDYNLGSYLDNLRDENPDDKLLAALDNARTRAELNKILSKSGRVNPIKLMDAPRSINTFYDSVAIDDIRFGFVARPFYIYSGDYSFIGGAGNVVGKIANNTIGTFGFVGGSLKYDGDYDKYSGAMFGGNIGMQYMDQDLYLRAFGTMSYVKFDGINAFDGTQAVRDVDGINGLGTIDVGLVYATGDELKIVPFVGVRADYASVMQDANMDIAARVGLNVNLDTNTDGNIYKFGARVFGQTDGVFYFGIGTDMISTADGVGGGASVGILYDDMGLSYKAELNIKFEF